MLTIHVWPRWVKEFLLTHPLYKSPYEISTFSRHNGVNIGLVAGDGFREGETVLIMFSGRG